MRVLLISHACVIPLNRMKLGALAERTRSLYAETLESREGAGWTR